MNLINTDALPFPSGLLPFLIVWSMVWKGFALWRAAHRGDKHWFIALLILNTIGILDALYLFVFGKDKPGVQEK